MKFCGNSPQKGGLVHQKGGRSERKRGSRQMYDTEGPYLPSFPSLSVRKIPRKYQLIPYQNTESGYNSIKCPNAKEFVQAIIKEVNRHVDSNNWTLRKQSKVPEDIQIVPSVWSL